MLTTSLQVQVSVLDQLIQEIDVELVYEAQFEQDYATECYVAQLRERRAVLTALRTQLRGDV